MSYTLILHDYVSLKRKTLRGHVMSWKEEFWCWAAPGLLNSVESALGVFPCFCPSICCMSSERRRWVQLGDVLSRGGIPRRNIQEAGRYQSPEWDRRHSHPLHHSGGSDPGRVCGAKNWLCPALMKHLLHASTRWALGIQWFHGVGSPRGRPQAKNLDARIY